MSLKNAKPGAMSVGHYQISSIPWVTSSILGASQPHGVRQFDLPRLSRFLYINITSPDNQQTVPHDARLALSFTSGGLDITHNRQFPHFFELVPNQQVTLDVRVDRFFVSASKGSPRFSVVAGLTEIDTSMQPTLTGSLRGIFSGVG